MGEVLVSGVGVSVLALEVEESECGLLLDGAEASESSAEEGVCEEGGDGGGESGFGGDEGLGDAGGEECGVAAAVEGDELEGVDHAGELIAQGCDALSFGATAEDMALICDPHPTFSEAIKESALAVNKEGINF